LAAKLAKMQRKKKPFAQGKRLYKRDVLFDVFGFENLVVIVHAVVHESLLSHPLITVHLGDISGPMIREDKDYQIVRTEIICCCILNKSLGYGTTRVTTHNSLF